MKKIIFFVVITFFGLLLLFLKPIGVSALAGEGSDAGADVGADGSAIANPVGIPGLADYTPNGNGGWSGTQVNSAGLTVSDSGGIGGVGGGDPTGGEPPCVNTGYPYLATQCMLQGGVLVYDTQTSTYSCDTNPQPTPPPPPPPPPPACGSSCSSNIDCQNIPNCTTCVGATPAASNPNCTQTGKGIYTDSNGNPCTPQIPATAGTCQGNPPTVTPPINCGSSCVKDADCAGAAAFNCGACVNNKCAPPPNCGSSCVKDADCAGAAAFNCGSCVNNKCAPPPPACGTKCDNKNPNSCLGAKDGCDFCGTNNTCQPPPSCGSACDNKNPNSCLGGKDNCTFCGADNKCAPPPPSCGSACVKDGDCVGTDKNACPVCSNNKCSAKPTPTFTPTPIPPTPTPTFNPASCICDGINYKNLATGQNATITSFAKITGNDALLGIITGQKFFLTQGADDIHGKIIAQSGLLPATLISQPARYQSVWTFKLPTLISGDTYRIWSQISCQPKNAAYGTSNVAGVPAATQRVVDNSLLGKLVAFVRHIFGVKDEQNIAVAPSPTSVPQIASKPAGSAVLGTDSLQLQTINPIDVYQKTCSFIKFRYNF